MTEIESKHIPGPRECKFYGYPCNINNFLLRPGGCECERQFRMTKHEYTRPFGYYSLIHDWIQAQISDGKSLDELISEEPGAKKYILEHESDDD